jgi:DNA-binding NarL/FixJ family response regulator
MARMSSFAASAFALTHGEASSHRGHAKEHYDAWNSVGRLGDFLSGFASHFGLSAGQVEVMRIALGEGLCDKKAAIRLKRDYRTIRTHWLRICEKLDCLDRWSAVALFINYVLTHVPPQGPRTDGAGSLLSRKRIVPTND